MESLKFLMQNTTKPETMILKVSSQCGDASGVLNPKYSNGKKSYWLFVKGTRVM